MAVKIKLDSAGIRAVLNSAEVADVLGALASDVASRIDETVADGSPLPVKTTSGTTDRAVAGVILAHPAGLPFEAKHGTLTQAAAAAGLEVRARGAAK